MTRSQSAPLLLIVALCWLPMSAQAVCEPPPRAVLWSYPADGAEGVPTDLAALWVWDSRRLWGVGGASLDGVPLESMQWGQYALPPLAPRTRYTVSLPDTTSLPDRGEPIVLHFTTGDGPLAPQTPLRFSVVNAYSLEGGSIGACEALVRSQLSVQLCENPWTLASVHFEVEGASDAVLWKLEGVRGSVWWPASCGAPSTLIDVRYRYSEYRCFDIKAVDRLGQIVEGGIHCPVPVARDAPSDGCNLIGTRRPLSDALACWYVVAAFGLAAYVSTRRRGAASSIPPSAD